jgi:3-deoxy-D-manno-octulosonic-acid transferase
MTRVLWVLYDASVTLAVTCVLVPGELVKIAVGRSHWNDLTERLGIGTPATSQARCRVLVHAVSVGEMAAGAALISAIGDQDPEARFILTTGTRQGREAGDRLRQRIPTIECVHFLPWDRHGALRQWLTALAPDAVVVVETEIWPNLFRVCRELLIPLFVVNGRLYPADIARYRLARRFFTEVLEAVDWIGTQDVAEKTAFQRIGAPADRTEAVGNLKFDAGSATPELPQLWRDALANRTRPPLIVAGSTHRPEESLLLDALVSLQARFPGVRLVLAPRHPDRCSRLLRLTASRRLATVLWSQQERAALAWDVLLVDEVGPLAAIFKYADVVFLGGSLVPRGGHNPLEAAAQQRPIVIGPSTHHFRGIVQGLADAGALTIVDGCGNTPQLLTDAFAHLLADPAAREIAGQRAFAFFTAGRGVAQRYARTLLTRLAAQAPPR